jgi:hypothetical protein
MRPNFIKKRLFLLISATAALACGEALAAPLTFQHSLQAESTYPLQAVHYRRIGVVHRSPWQAPYHVSRNYRGGPGARMGLVAQGIIPPPQHSYYSYPGFYWNNYFYYPNYRMIYDF